MIFRPLPLIDVGCQAIPLNDFALGITQIAAKSCKPMIVVMVYGYADRAGETPPSPVRCRKGRAEKR